MMFNFLSENNPYQYLIQKEIISLSNKIEHKSNTLTNKDLLERLVISKRQLS